MLCNVKKGLVNIAHFLGFTQFICGSVDLKGIASNSYNHGQYYSICRWTGNGQLLYGYHSYYGGSDVTDTCPMRTLSTREASCVARAISAKCEAL